VFAIAFESFYQVHAVTHMLCSLCLQVSTLVCMAPEDISSTPASKYDGVKSDIQSTYVAVPNHNTASLHVDTPNHTHMLTDNLLYIMLLAAGGHAGVHGARGDILHTSTEIRRRQKRHLELLCDNKFKRK
jgi:hypothetical protein